MSIGDLWAGGGGTVYIQGHPVIPNPWGDAVTNETTTTTTDDTTDKGGGDDEEPCISDECKDALEKFTNDYSLYLGWIAAKQTFIEDPNNLIWVPEVLREEEKGPKRFGWKLTHAKFATQFFKELFGEDYKEAVLEMYDRMIKEYGDKWNDDCIDIEILCPSEYKPPECQWWI